MLADVLKDKRFDLFFSFLVGIFLAILLRPVCKDGKCNLWKTPPMADLRTNAYKIGEKCFRFHANERECPTVGVIEPFEWNTKTQTR
jgi:hypothetical protein